VLSTSAAALVVFPAVVKEELDVELGSAMRRLILGELDVHR
jgi:hypothetical protein